MVSQFIGGLITNKGVVVAYATAAPLILGMEELIMQKNMNHEEWERVHSHESHYEIYRQIQKDSSGKISGCKWKAKNIETGEEKEITYDQARGYEPIEDSSIKQLSRYLGEKLLPPDNWKGGE